MKIPTITVSRSHWPYYVLGFLIALFSIYLSYFTIVRMHTLYAHHFDLGIMHQTVYNTYMALRTGDFERILLLTDPHGSAQIYRPAIHNDSILALLAPFYFVWNGPETLLVIQAFAIGLGAIPVFLITRILFAKATGRWPDILGLAFSFAYLLNPSNSFTAMFDFHPVALATPLLLYAWYFWLTNRLRWSIAFLVLAMLTKEQVALTTLFFGIFVWLYQWRTQGKKVSWFPVVVMGISLLWFLLTMKVIIPYYRSLVDLADTHFALEYFSAFGGSTTEVIFGVLTNPLLVLQKFSSPEAIDYLVQILLPVGFMALVAPLVVLVALPELGIVLLSENGAMRNIYFHYTAVITPIVVIASIYGARQLFSWFPSAHKNDALRWISFHCIGMAMIAAYWFGPLPFSEEQNLHPFKYPPGSMAEVYYWQEQLADDQIKVAATGKLAPFFASREYYYILSDAYPLADYVVVNTAEVYNTFKKEEYIVGYEAIQTDENFEIIFDKNNIQVYRKR